MNDPLPHRDAARPRVLGIAGSPRGGSNSAALLDTVLEPLGGACETETIRLAELDLRPCEGCHYCEAHRECCIADDMSAVYRKLLEAEAIVLAAPAYMGGLCSRMQAFMERTWPLRKGRLSGKVGSYVVVGRRRIGMATGVMEEYFTRVGMVKLPGVLGYAFEAGSIEQDAEAVNQAGRLAADLRARLGLGSGRGPGPPRREPGSAVPARH